MSTVPLDALRQFLETWYDQHVQSALRAPKPEQELLTAGGSVFDLQPELSSINAVPVLLRLKDILGFEPSKKVIRRGGYRTKHEFVTHMIQSIVASAPAHLALVDRIEVRTAHDGAA